MPSDFDVVSEAIAYVVDHRAAQPSLAAVAAHVNLSPDHVQRVFTRWAGISPKRLLQFLNAAAARDLLSSEPVLAAANAIGVSSQSRVYDAFVQIEAVTPGDVRRAGDGLEIRTGWVGSPFGDAFVATTPRGICALAFAAEGRDPEERLRLDWPAADVISSDQRELGERIFAPLAERADAPLAVVMKGTNLQVQVWSALVRIPEGTTRSYGAVAAELGVPRSVRAVANAIGANRVGFLIPCHRVLRENGAISGYAWGPLRKRAMLARERAAAELLAGAIPA